MSTVLAHVGVRLGAQVRLVDEDEVPVVREDLGGLRLEVVHARDHDIVGRPDALAGQQSAFQDGQQGAGHDGGVDVEEVVERFLPLAAEVRGDHDEDPPCLAAGEQLGDDQAGLDGLSRADIICDQQPYPFVAERHQQGNDLVVGGDGSGPLEAEDGRGAMQEREPLGVDEQPLVALVAHGAGQG